MTDAEPTKKAQRYYTKHGLTILKKAVRVLGGRPIDRRTAIGRALEDWRHSIIQDLGGVDQTSTQQRVKMERKYHLDVPVFPTPPFTKSDLKMKNQAAPPDKNKAMDNLQCIHQLFSDGAAPVTDRSAPADGAPRCCRGVPSAD